MSIRHKKINTVTLGTRQRRIDTGNIGHKKRVTLGTRRRKLDTGYIGHKTQKDRHVYV